MIQKETIAFLQKLKKNNNKEWFDKNRKSYEVAKKDFEAFTADVIEKLSKSDPDIAGLKAKDCVFRIFKDVRFSKDKRPYKHNMGAAFTKGGKKSPFGGYYFHLEPGKCFVAGGMWMPDSETLNKVRQEIDYNFTQWKKIVESKKFNTTFTKGIEGDSLVRPPKGYDEENPAIDYLKRKSFILSTEIPDKLLTDKKLVPEVVKSFLAMKEMIDFLNHSVD